MGFGNISWLAERVTCLDRVQLEVRPVAGSNVDLLFQP